jgi:hypothetical protein
MREIKTETNINAPASTVWSILTDFQRFPEWNPFITKASGQIKENAQLKIRIEPPDSSAMYFKPTVTRIKEEREFGWLGRLWIPGIFDGEHVFEIEPINKNKIHFVQREKFKGLLVPLLWKSLDKNTRHGYEKMNLALKKRAEQQIKSLQ